MSEHEKELLRWYLKDNGFRVDEMPADIIDQCYQYCAERLALSGDYGAVFESLLGKLLDAMKA